MSNNDHHQDGAAVGLPASGAAFLDNGQPPTCVDRAETDLDIITRLEMLDDVVFAAIDGDATALQMASDAWHAALADLGAEAVDESRQQYLRHAQSVWEALRHTPNHPPHRLFAAIEIISLLAGRGDSKR